MKREMSDAVAQEENGRDGPAKPKLRSGAIGLRLSRNHRYTVFGISLGVWITGVVWVVFHYFFQTEGPFGFQKHPMETISLKVHGGMSFASLWIFGTLWWTHVVRGWISNWRRWSGGILAAAILVLIITGWGLYYFVERDWREWTSLIHWSLGIASLAIFFLHWLSKSPARRAPN